jgi:hypothetical protein
VKRVECTQTKEHERNKEREDRKRQEFEPSMNRTERSVSKEELQNRQKQRRIAEQRRSGKN